LNVVFLDNADRLYYTGTVRQARKRARY